MAIPPRAVTVALSLTSTPYSMVTSPLTVMLSVPLKMPPDAPPSSMYSEANVSDEPVLKVSVPCSRVTALDGASVVPAPKTMVPCPVWEMLALMVSPDPNVAEPPVPLSPPLTL